MIETRYRLECFRDDRHTAWRTDDADAADAEGKRLLRSGEADYCLIIEGREGGTIARVSPDEEPGTDRRSRSPRAHLERALRAS